MKEEGVSLLSDRMEEIIMRVQSDTSITDALIKDKNFYNNFNSTLNELNELLIADFETLKSNNLITI